ncbi:MAG: ABC transporter permease [Buchananella hordeovulneris]|nr:ABC transporter permease [Buchananella hordeovulneris]
MKNLDFIRTVTISNRSNRNRLLGIIAGVMVGVSLALMLLAASNSFSERNLRSTWVSAQGADSIDISSQEVTVGNDQLLAVPKFDNYRGDIINVLYFYTPAGSTASIRGVPQLPEPGTFLASPALAKLVKKAGPGELAERWGTMAGVLPESAVRGPDSLSVLVARPLEQVMELARTGDPVLVHELVGADFSSTAYRIVAMIGAVAVLVPALLLIGIVTELGAVQRQQRFSTLRLIGATPGQVASVSALETVVTSLVGSLLGIGLYLAAVPLAAQIRIEGSRFYPADLLLDPLSIAAVVICVVAASTGWSWIKARRLGRNPLARARAKTECRPRVWSLISLVLGVAAFAAPAASKMLSPDGESTLVDKFVAELLLVGFLGTAFGLLWAGPWLTAGVSRLVGRWAGSPALVVGANRVANHPRAAFRSVAGMVIAVFTVTFFSVGVTAAASVFETYDGPDAMPEHALTAYAFGEEGDLEALAEKISQVNGVKHVLRFYPSAADSRPEGTYFVASAEDGALLGLPIPAGEEWISVSESWLRNNGAANTQAGSPPTQSGRENIMFLVLTDGDPASVERARTTMLLTHSDWYGSPRTPLDTTAFLNTAPEIEFSILASIGILIAAAISTVALGVSTYAAFLERLRVFGLLRLSGMPKRVLGRITAWEAALPMATVFLLSVGLGAFSAWALITGVSHRQVGVPSPIFLGVLGVCIALMASAVFVTARAASKADMGGITRFE